MATDDADPRLVTAKSTRLVKLTEEVDRLKAEFAAYRAAVDAYVARNVWQTLRPDRAWQSMETGCSIYRTRADAEAAFRRATQLPEATEET